MDEPFDFETAYDAISAAMMKAATTADDGPVFEEAKKWGLLEQAVEYSPVTLRREWRRIGGTWTLIFRWRWYDPTPPFSPNLPDINVLSLELSENGKVVRNIEERFEDRRE